LRARTPFINFTETSASNLDVVRNASTKSLNIGRSGRFIGCRRSFHLGNIDALPLSLVELSRADTASCEVNRQESACHSVSVDYKASGNTLVTEQDARPVRRTERLVVQTSEQYQYYGSRLISRGIPGRCSRIAGTSRASNSGERHIRATRRMIGCRQAGISHSALALSRIVVRCQVSKQ